MNPAQCQQMDPNDLMKLDWAFVPVARCKQPSAVEEWPEPGFIRKCNWPWRSSVCAMVSQEFITAWSGGQASLCLFGPHKTSQPVWGSAGVLLNSCGEPVCLRGLSGATYTGDVMVQQDAWPE